MFEGSLKMKYSDLIVLSHRSTLNEIDEDGKIIPHNKDDFGRVEYISQGLQIDLKKKLYKTRFGADSRDNYIQNGFVIKDGWYQIGTMIISDHGPNGYGDGLLGVYDRTNFQHLYRMVCDAVEANMDWSNAD
jgi:hypothetical protein